MSERSYIRRISAITLAVFAVLLVSAVVCYRERMLFVDPAWISFHLINTKSFVFTEHRYGAFVSQLFPLAGIYTGSSLSTILILYSAGFYVFYTAVGCVVGITFRQPGLAILLALYLTLFISDGYYWPNNEVHQGIAWAILFIGMHQWSAHKPGSRPAAVFLQVVVAALAISSHLLVAVPMLYLWVFIHAKSGVPQLIRSPRFAGFSILLIGLMLAKYQLSNAGWYDPVKLEGVKHLSLNRLAAAFRSGQSRTFAGLVIKNYWLAPLLLLGSVAVLAKSRRYFQLLVCLAFTVGYYLLICLTFPDAYQRNLRFYMESEWAALSIIISAPLVHFLTEQPRAAWLPALLLLVFGVRLGYMFQSHAYFHRRLQNLETVTHTLHQQHIHKAVLAIDKAHGDSLFIMDWGLPVESMMLSRMEGAQGPTATIKLISSGEARVIQARDSFYSCFSVEPVQSLNNRYFVLDSTQSYQTIPEVRGLRLLE